jgi:DNA-binding NarL/FixJ family response regulator
MSDALATLETVTTCPRVLVADDDPELREALVEMLEALGFEVIGRAADGAEAVAMALELRPGVILMDLRMPNLDGIEATRQIKAILPRTQVVILTAYSDPVLREEADGAGAYCYLLKGCPTALVTSVVRSAGSEHLGLESRARES